MVRKQAAYRTSPVDGRAFFPGLVVKDAVRLEWKCLDDETDRGHYWTATDDKGITWLSDGKERIATFPSRMFRFYVRGIASRRKHLLNRYLKGLVPRPLDGTVINFGANVGEVAITFAENGAQVLAIEPDPNVLPLLRANAVGRSIDVVPVAAWNSDGFLTLYLKSETADSSTFNVSDHSVSVAARRIDTLVQERGIDRVALLIGDAEGAEPEVLEGACETLRITEYVSVCASAERCGERTLEACEVILKDAGFDILHREESGFCTLIGRNRAFLREAA